MRRRSSNTVKTLHSGHTFTSRDSFPPGVLPTKRQVIERILHLKNFRTETVANDIAEEIHDRWIWCNVYPVHKYTISKKVQNLVASFSSLDRWTKSRRGNTFLQRESEFMQTIDSLFDVFCVDDQQRKNLEKQHGLRMAEADYAFYQDQKSERVGKCMDTVVPLSSSDKMFLRRHPQSTEPTCSSTETAAPSTSACGYVSDCSSVQTEHSQSSTTSEFVPDAESFSQNRMKWSNLARMSERFQVSDRAAAAIANSVMQDLGFITENDKTYVIDRSKLRRERERCRTEIREKEQENFKLVNAIYFDGRKDATQVTIQGPNDKYYKSVQLEDHYTLIGEPGEYYLTHFSTEDGKGKTIAQKIFNNIVDTELHNKLAIVGTDGTASMTGKYNGCIRSLEELLNKPLQWVVCLLHTNELPLRHVFTMLDGTTKSPDSFSGPIGKSLNGEVSSWPVAAHFKSIPNPHFVKLPVSVIEDLSADQHYAYKICSAVIEGVVDSDLQYLKVGPIVHSRWLTLGCRILRYYISMDNPSSNLEILAQFCLQVYFPSWFEIKSNSQLTRGSKNLFNLVQRILNVPNEIVRETALKVVQRNGFFAHQENILVGMFGDDDEKIRMLGVNKVLSIRRELTSADSSNLLAMSVNEEHSSELTCDTSSALSVRPFNVPVINLTATSFDKMVDLTSWQHQPPAIEHLTDTEIEQCRARPLKLDHPCHNQSVERHAKLVTEASAQVEGFARRDGMIRQKIKSRKLLKTFNTKMQF